MLLEINGIVFSIQFDISANSRGNSLFVTASDMHLYSLMELTDVLHLLNPFGLIDSTIAPIQA